MHNFFRSLSRWHQASVALIQIIEFFDDVAKLGVNKVARQKEVSSHDISLVLHMRNRSGVLLLAPDMRRTMKGKGV